MTCIYLLRNVQPEIIWDFDELPPLSLDDILECQRMKNILLEIPIDTYVSGTDKYMKDTISEIILDTKSNIVTDKRFNMRKGTRYCYNGSLTNEHWNNFNYQEDECESILKMQNRSIKAIQDILRKYKNKHMVISTDIDIAASIISYYDNKWKPEDYKRLCCQKPFIVRLDFDENRCLFMKNL